MKQTRILPLLPLRDIVVFPSRVSPLFVGREKSVRALEAAMAQSKDIVLATQKKAGDDNPAPEDIHEYGVLANVLQLLKLPDGTVKVLVEGQHRLKIVNFSQTEELFEVEAEDCPEVDGDSNEAKALAKAALTQFDSYQKLHRKIAAEVIAGLSQMKDPGKIADVIAANLSVKLELQQELLATDNVVTRLEKILGLMESEVGVLQVEKRIRNRVKRQMEKSQREYYLNEQMKAIQRELGSNDDGHDELAELDKKIQAAKLPKEAREKAEAELRKLRQMSPMSAESTVVRNYLDWILALPWSKKKKVKKDLDKAAEILDADHFGLEKVKERVLEFLAVQSRTEKARGPILCLVGPPGVGKTSLGRSIATATGRDFVRVSLGGVRDEAEIRGHRRTYVGSMPGRIVQSLKKASSNNPLFLLDEIDKMGSDYRGDPAAALLEVLDPEQNSTFADHYLEVDYDLSNVMFITTANSLNMPQPLLDRMEIIRIPGYTEDEKVEIARRHLLPKQIEANGLRAGEFSIDDEGMRDLIRYYTREAGVRNLERELAGLGRKAVREITQKKSTAVDITAANLGDYAGVRKCRFGEAELEDQIGAVTGLAWTEVGGDTLTIEALKMFGKGRMTVTGNLKDVMKESISAASSYVRARAPQFGIKPTLFDAIDIHVHVPEGAVPKDGPSAGIAMMTAIVSLLTGNPVSKSVAMTGEITLRGKVLPIGGLKEKLLAALRAGVSTVLIPAENAKDLADVPENVTKGLTIHPVATADDVLKFALTRPLVPIEWTDEDQAAALAGRSSAPSNDGPRSNDGSLAH